MIFYHVAIPTIQLLTICIFLLLKLNTAIDLNVTDIDIEVFSPNHYFGGADHESYLSWYDENESSYTGRMYLPADGTTTNSSNNGVAIHWKVDAINEVLYIAVAARAQGGWIAFGMAEAGGMKGADIVIHETSKPDTLTDAYVLSERVPLIDTCQDWEHVATLNEGGFLIMEGSRKFDTKDTQDHVVFNDSEEFITSQKVIAAWGDDTDTIQYHGKTNRARGALRWFGVDDESTSFRQRMAKEATGYFDISFDNYLIPANETDYAYFCFNWVPDIVPQGLSPDSNVVMLSAEMILDPISGPFVHHSSIVSTRTAIDGSRQCLTGGLTKYDQYLYGWTFGTSPLQFPSDAGFTIGPQGGLQSFIVEVHYNNPNLISGMMDNSKFRIYYSETPRTYEMGLALMGDLFLKMKRTTINSGASKFNFGCSDQCSLLVLDEPITVVNELFHMHSAGSAAAQYQVRNGEVLRQANVNYFDFDQAGLQAVRQRPYQVLPGDAFSTSCFYETRNATTFGQKSTQEMCIAYLLYYPAKTIFNRGPWYCGLGVPISACNASVTSSEFTLTDDNTVVASKAFQTTNFFERTFGLTTTDQCLQKSSDTTNSSNNDDTTTSGTLNVKIRGLLSLMYILLSYGLVCLSASFM